MLFQPIRQARKNQSAGGCYKNGDEELYDEKHDPNEWTNLAGKTEYADKKAELRKFMPTENHTDIGGKGGAEK